MEITRRNTNNITSVKEIDLSEFFVDTTANFSLHIPLDCIRRAAVLRRSNYLDESKE